MSDQPTPQVLEFIGQAIAAVPGLELRPVSPTRWERRSAQVWYRVEALPVRGAPQRLLLEAGVLVPLVERMLDADDSPSYLVGGSLLRLAGESANAFELHEPGRRGRLVARLRTPVLGGGVERPAVADESFAHDVHALLSAAMTPLIRLTTWEHVGGLLEAEGMRLAARGVAPADHEARQAVLRWAAGDPERAAGVLRAVLGTQQAADVEARLAARFHANAA